MSRILLCIFTLSFLLSCEKNISFKPNDTKPAVVVEAFIESGRFPEVRLSTSLNYFTRLTPELLSASFIHHAEITISNGSVTHRLKEYSRPFVNGLNVYYYTIDSSRISTAFRGENGKNYSLVIKADGKEFKANTTIPPLTKVMDSLWWTPAPVNAGTNRAALMARIIDPPGLGNYIRYYVQLERRPFFPPPTSVFDDQIVDGKTYSVQLESGVNRSESDFDDDPYFFRGDSVTVKLANIDKATFDFWRTMEYNYSSIGNPFSSPTKVLGNISGDALGYFGGYAVQYKGLKIPD